MARPPALPWFRAESVLEGEASRVGADLRQAGGVVKSLGPPVTAEPGDLMALTSQPGGRSHRPPSQHIHMSQWPTPLTVDDTQPSPPLSSLCLPDRRPHWDSAHDQRKASFGLEELCQRALPRTELETAFRKLRACTTAVQGLALPFPNLHRAKTPAQPRPSRICPSAGPGMRYGCSPSYR